MASLRNSVLGVAAIAVLIFLFSAKSCSNRNLKSELETAKKNLAALQDTIEETQNRLGQVQYEKSVLVTSKKGLEDLNAELAEEVKAQKGKVAYLQSVVARFSTPSPGPITVVPVPSTDKNPCDTTVTYDFPWDFSQRFDPNNYRSLRGNTRVTISMGQIVSSNAEVLEDDLGFNLVTGLEKRKDHYEIFIRSDYPGFKPSKIDGAVIPQDDLYPKTEERKWSVGPSFNAGIGVAPWPTPQPVIYIGVGFGLNYSIF